MTNLNFRRLTVLSLCAIAPLSFFGCEQNFEIVSAPAKEAPPPATAGNPPVVTPPNAKVGSAQQEFDAATSNIKKIDFLFVVDNSKSMEPYQEKLAAGFEVFARTFYQRTDLDICTAIITSDRYAGKGSASYSRERYLGCTKPAGWESKSPSEMQAYIDNLINEFKAQVNVGISGSGTELLGKSLVSFMYMLSKWSDDYSASNMNKFFRADAATNISVLTDENNWFLSNSVSEASNDLPASTGDVYDSVKGLKDARKGLKQRLDEFFSALRPGQGVSYSVTSFINLSYPTTPKSTNGAALAQNFNLLSKAVGRESASVDIAGSSNSYADHYQSIAEGLVQRASSFHVKNAIHDPANVKVTLVKSTGQRAQLTKNEFSVLLPSDVSLSASIVNSVQPGDKVVIDYGYLLP